MPNTVEATPGDEASMPGDEGATLSWAVPPAEVVDVEEDDEEAPPTDVASMPDAAAPMPEEEPDDVAMPAAEASAPASIARYQQLLIQGASRPESAAEEADRYWARSCEGRGAAVRAAAAARTAAALASMGQPGGLAIGASRGKGDAAKGKRKSGGKKSKGSGSMGKGKGSAKKGKTNKSKTKKGNPDDDDTEGGPGSAAASAP